MKKAFKTIGVILAAVLVAYTFFFLWKQSQPTPVVYDIETPTVTNITVNAMATGDIEPRVQIELKPKVTGVITELRVQAGDNVKVGDVIALINVIPDMNMLNQAQSAVEQAQINLQQVTRDAARSQKLFDEGVVSKEENEHQQNALLRAREDLAAARYQIEVITKGSSKRSGTVNTTEVRSTMNGIVLDVPVKVGTSVSGSSQFSQGTTIAKVGNMSDVIFDGNIDETSVDKLALGMEMTLRLGAVEGKEAKATLEYIAPEAKIVNGAKMFRIKGAITTTSGITFRSGYSANAVIKLSEAKQVLAVNESAVVFENGNPYVYKLVSDAEDTENQQFERIPVKLGLSDGIFVQIISGINKDAKLRGKQL